MSEREDWSAPGRGAAGRRGDDIRSDLWAGVDLTDSGGVRIELESRVEPYYGDAIREQARSLLDSLGTRNARVVVEDKGALPFVIAARIETAALRAGLETAGDGRPAATAPVPESSAKDRLRRSRLYLPGNEPKYLINAGLFGADGIILDLEDSVHVDEKDAARLVVRNALRCVDFRTSERMVRINQLPLGLEDLDAIVPERPDLILIPKVESPDQVREVDETIDRIRARTGSDRDLWLMPIVESALGVERCFDIARASERIAAMTIGLEDYAADLGVPKSSDGRESHYARLRLVNAARAAGVQAIDSVYGQVDDEDGLRRWGENAKAAGFVGMGCLHPSQIPAVHESFRPSADQIARARRIVDAFERARAEGLAVVSLGSKMIDPPVVRQAVRLVERAVSMGLLPDEEANR